MNSTPPKTQAQLQKEALAAAAKNLKSQILARSASSGLAASLVAGSGRLASAASSGRASAAGSTSGKKEVKTLDEYLAGERCIAGLLNQMLWARGSQAGVDTLLAERCRCVSLAQGLAPQTGLCRAVQLGAGAQQQRGELLCAAGQRVGQEPCQLSLQPGGLRDG